MLGQPARKDYAYNYFTLSGVIRLMKRLSPSWILAIVTLLVSIIYWIGVAAVPFHPDEATQIFMSSDLEIFFRQPSDTFWQPQPLDGLRQHYRLVDAPLTRWLIGFGRMVSGQPALAVDWAWNKSWEENQAAGALPDPGLLLVSRFSVAWLFPITLFMMFRIGDKLGGARLGWIAFILLDINALVLLHTRRAMAESALLFAAVFFLWALLYWRKHPWLIAIPLALASKQSTALLALVGLAAIFLPEDPLRRFRTRLLHAAAYAGIFLILLLLLNPYLWNRPFEAAWSAWDARQQLVEIQVKSLREVIPHLVPDTLPKTFLGLMVNLYLTEPAVGDVGNYTAYTEQAAFAYFSNPLHNLLRDTTGAGLLFALTIVGFLLAIRDMLKLSLPARGDLVLLIMANLLQFISVMFFVPLAFQRYVIPLVPFACLWSAYCAARLWEKFCRIKNG
jgi:hypothetical protein